MVSGPLELRPHYLASVLQTTPKVLGGNGYVHSIDKAHGHMSLPMMV